MKNHIIYSNNGYMYCEDYNSNSNLPGAVSNDSEFYYIDNNDNIETCRINKFVSNEFYNLKEQGIYVNERGAVASACYLGSFFREEDKENALNEFLKRKQEEYPDYEFEIYPGEFPIEYHQNKGVLMSTHVLYITDWGKYLNNKKDKVKTK